LTKHLNDGYVYWLPSEEEWEYAARGALRRRYAWGDQPPGSERANFSDIYRSTAPVGCFSSGNTPEGLVDMIGNVWEWTATLDQLDHPHERAIDEADDESLGKGGWITVSSAMWYRSGPGLDQMRMHAAHAIRRGGAWDSPVEDIFAFRRSYRTLDYAGLNCGLRLVRHKA
jgi:formylglycine-generating enzyme required for sulfatase activity